VVADAVFNDRLRCSMSLIQLLLVVWGVITTVLVVLMIYRSTLSIHEDNQLFIEQSESHMEQEQTALLVRMKRLQMPLRVLGSASALLILIVFGIWLWKGLNQM
jgi:hypothetical protein